MLNNEVKQETTFEYNYSSAKQKELEAIKKKYMPQEEDKMETLRRLDRSTERRGTICALAFGIVGTLVFGTGMSLAMVWTDSLLVLGTLVSLLGMVILGLAYPVYKLLTKRQREKLAPQILALTEELLNGKV